MGLLDAFVSSLISFSDTSYESKKVNKIVFEKEDVNKNGLGRGFTREPFDQNWTNFIFSYYSAKVTLKIIGEKKS